MMLLAITHHIAYDAVLSPDSDIFCIDRTLIVTNIVDDRVLVLNCRRRSVTSLLLSEFCKEAD